MRNSNKSHRIKRDTLKRTEQVTPDDAVLNLLNENGSNLSKEKLVHFYLYFPEKESAKIADNKLRDLGFEVDCLKSADDKNWLCLASKEIKLNSAELTSLREKLENLTLKHGGFYDGWETEL